MKERRIGRRTTPYGLYAVMDFGKWYGSQIQAIIEKDPDYLAWCLDNVAGFELDSEADYVLELALLD